MKEFFSIFRKTPDTAPKGPVAIVDVGSLTDESFDTVVNDWLLAPGIGARLIPEAKGQLLQRKPTKKRGFPDQRRYTRLTSSPAADKAR